MDHSSAEFIELTHQVVGLVGNARIMQEKVNNTDPQPEDSAVAVLQLVLVWRGDQNHVGTQLFIFYFFACTRECPPFFPRRVHRLQASDCAIACL